MSEKENEEAARLETIQLSARYADLLKWLINCPEIDAIQYSEVAEHDFDSIFEDLEYYLEELGELVIKDRARELHEWRRSGDKDPRLIITAMEELSNDLNIK